MNLRSATLVLGLGAVVAIAAESSAHVWKATEVKGFEQKLAGKKTGGQSLGNWGSYNAGINHREANGEAEVHQHTVDFMVVRSGEATIVLGGKVPNAKPTTAGELRGPAIEGGEKHKVGPGDVIHIPANTPHQFLVEPGKQITYTTVKIHQGR